MSSDPSDLAPNTVVDPTVDTVVEDDATRADTVIDPVIRVPSLMARVLCTAFDGLLVAAGALAAGALAGHPLPLHDAFEPDAWARWVEAGGPIVAGAAAVVTALVLQGALPRSPGKLLGWLEVVRTKDAAPIGKTRRWIRAGLAVLTTGLSGLGAAWMLISPRQRALYDLATGTAVAVRPRRRSQPSEW